MIALLQVLLVLVPVLYFAFVAVKPAVAGRDLGLVNFKSLWKVPVWLVFSLILVNMFVVIPGGSRGVVFSQTAGVEKRILNEGMSILVPVLETPTIYDVQRHTVDIDLGQNNAAASNDVQDVYAVVKVNYRPKPDRVNMTWQEVGDRESLEKNILTPQVTQVLKSVIPRFAAAEIIKQRETIADATLREINNSPTVTRYMEVFSIAVNNVDFRPEFRQLLEQKAQKTQELEIAMRDVEIAKQAKLKLITQAQGDAESTKTRADAAAYQNKVLAQTVTPKSLQSRQVDIQEILAKKWQGGVPGTYLNMGGSSRGGNELSVLNLNSLFGKP